MAAVEPDIVIVMPRGFDTEFAHREAEMHRDRTASVGAGEVVAGEVVAGEVVAVDAAAYLSRPGPRIVDGLELLGAIIHPELVPENPEYAGKSLTVEP